VLKFDRNAQECRSGQYNKIKRIAVDRTAINSFPATLKYLCLKMHSQKQMAKMNACTLYCILHSLRQ